MRVRSIFLLQICVSVVCSRLICDCQFYLFFLFFSAGFEILAWNEMVTKCLSSLIVNVAINFSSKWNLQHLFHLSFQSLYIEYTYVVYSFASTHA